MDRGEHLRGKLGLVGGECGLAVGKGRETNEGIRGGAQIFSSLDLEISSISGQVFLLIERDWKTFERWFSEWVVWDGELFVELGMGLCGLFGSSLSVGFGQIERKREKGWGSEYFGLSRGSVT